MSDQTITPKGTVINKVWVDTARACIKSKEDRAELYEAMFDLAFGVSDTPPRSESARAIYCMCKPFILEDVQKYQARCIRNRENAKGGRVAASGSESLPMAPNNKSKTNNNTNTNNNNNNISLNADAERKKDIFDCTGIFFKRCIAQPLKECEMFYSYYESLGWRNGKGAPIVDKKAAARMWTPKGDAVESKEWRAAWYNAFARAEVADTRIWSHIRHAETRIESVEGKSTAVLWLFVADLEGFVSLLEDRCLAQITACARSMKADCVQYCLA